MAKLVLCHVAKLSKIKEMWHLQMICSKFAIEVNPFFRPVLIFEKRRRRQQQTPQQREHRFAQRRRSRRQETEERLQRLQTCTDSCNCGIFSLPLYSIQYFLNAEGQNTAITMRIKPMKRTGRPGEVEHYWKFLV